MGLLVASTPFTDDRSPWPTRCCSSPRRASAPASGSPCPPSTRSRRRSTRRRSTGPSSCSTPCSGLGTALAPVFVAIFVGLGFWWGLPVLSAVLLVGLIATSRGLPLQPGAAPPRPDTRPRAPIPPRFALYGAFAVLYGICETLNGNWSQLDMTTEVGASTTVAAIALTTFWAMVTLGRVLFAADPEPVPEPPRLPRAALRAGRGARRHRRPPRGRHGGRGAGVRPRRPGLLRPPPADHQLRPGGPGHDVGGDRRPGHRRLPARLRHRRLRGRPAPGRRRQPAGHLRHRRRRRGGDGRPLVRHRPTGPASSPRCTPDRSDRQSPHDKEQLR